MSDTRTPSLTHHASAERSDVSALRAAQGQLSHEPGLLAALDAVHDIAFILDEHRQIVHCNRRALEALGLQSPSELLGNRPGEAFACTNAHRMAAGCGTSEACRSCGAVNAILTSLDTRAPAAAECRIAVRTPEGPDTLELAVKTTPIEIGGRRLIALTAQDVSVQNRKASLERVFFHDALNLVGAIEALATGLAEQAQDAATGEQCVRMAALVEQLVEQLRSQRDLASAERGDLRPNPTTFDAFELLDELRRGCERQPHAAGRTIACRVPDAADIVLTADRTLLARTVGNLLKNALEASAPGETVTMSVVRTEAGLVQFAVHNVGFIPVAAQTNVFQRSFTTKREPGRGLGTFSVRLLTERYLGGTVEFQSDPTRGTTFCVTLPQGAAGEAERPAPNGAAPLAGRRVLLADDAEDTRRMHERLLRRAGADVACVGNGRAAVEQALTAARGERPFDAVLLDVDMPLLDGPAAAARLRERGYRGAIVALTGYGDERPRSLAAGCDEHIEKPVSRDALIGTLVRVLAERPA